MTEIIRLSSHLSEILQEEDAFTVVQPNGKTVDEKQYEDCYLKFLAEERGIVIHKSLSEDTKILSGRLFNLYQRSIGSPEWHEEIKLCDRRFKAAVPLRWYLKGLKQENEKAANFKKNFQIPISLGYEMDTLFLELDQIEDKILEVFSSIQSPRFQ